MASSVFVAGNIADCGPLGQWPEHFPIPKERIMLQRHRFQVKATTVAIVICMAITIATQAGQPPVLQASPGKVAPKPPPT